VRSSDPILDWHLNTSLPEAVSVLAEAKVAELITPASLDPIYRQLDLNYPTWQIWGPSAEGVGWSLLPDDYLYNTNLGTLIPAAMAWLRSEKIVVYAHGLICIIQPDESFTVGRIK
jgi:hypothetical protein